MERHKKVSLKESPIRFLFLVLFNLYFTPYYFLMMLALLFVGPIFVLVGTLITGSIRKATRWYNVNFGRILITLCWPFVRIKIHGRENAQGLKRAVIICNHTSTWDICFSTFSPLANRVAFAKEWVFKLPIIGGFMKLGQFVNMSRIDMESFIKVTENPAYNECSFLIYPEGTRSKSGKLGRFHSGAFFLSIKEKLPILPIYITGIQNFFQNRYPFFQPVKANIYILPTASPQPYLQEKDHKSFRKAVKDLYLKKEAEVSANA